MNDGMRNIILEKLHQLEIRQDIRILYACESGSRAWGFASPDSDFDVRFIYARKMGDYLSITDSRDVVELPVNEVLDISGWDLRKALQLFLKSNAPLYEWLQSPIVYMEDGEFLNGMKELMPTYFSLKAAANHYLSMTVNTVSKDLQGGDVKLKRYFYALRPALACLWIVEKEALPPMEFALLRSLISGSDIEEDIDELLKVKAGAGEKALTKPFFRIDAWLADTIDHCRGKIPMLRSEKFTTAQLDIFFRKYVQV